MPAGLILKLCHPFELADRRHRREHPRKLSVLDDMGLYEQHALSRIDAGRQQTHGHLERPPLQSANLVRLCNSMIIHDADETLVTVLKLDPVLDRAKIVSDVEFAGWLNAREYA